MKFSSLGLLATLFFCSAAIATEAPSKSVYVMAGWSGVGQSKDPQSCEIGQYRYQRFLLDNALKNNLSLSTKSDYYSFATWLGYFSDDPVEKSEIAQKIKPIADRESAEMIQRVQNGQYFLFAGSLGSEPDVARSASFHNISLAFRFPAFGNYDWENDVLSASFGTYWKPRLNRYTGKSELYLEHADWTASPTLSTITPKITIQVTPKEWKEYWEAQIGLKQTNHSSDGLNHLGARMLTDSYLRPLLAQIFIRSTGKTIVSWAAEGQDLKKLTALVPELPAEKYQSASCDGLNPEYFKTPTSRGGLQGIDDSINKLNEKLNFQFKLF